MTFEPSINCECSSERSPDVLRFCNKPAAETDFGFADSGYERSYDECTTCGHYFGRHNLPLAQIYESSYVDSTYGNSHGMVQRLEKILALPAEESDNALRVRRIEAFYLANLGQSAAAQNQRKLLDVGAGIGVFPAAMKVEGWEVVAIEPDPRTVLLLSSVVKVKALQEDFLDLSADRIGKFNAITFNKVLEHVEDPSDLLSHARGFLAERGFCYVEVPDVHAATQGKQREEFFVEHHHVFSPASLSILVQNSGFDLVRLERLVEPSGKFTLCAFMEPGPTKTPRRRAL